jgi:YcxB-like protein
LRLSVKSLGERKGCALVIQETVCEYRLTKKETIRQLWRLLLKPSLAVLMILMMLAGVGALVLQPSRPLWAYGLVIFPLFFVYFFYRTVHTIIAQHPELLETQTLRFDKSGLSVTNTVSTVQWPWERVHGVVESTDFVVLRLDTIGSGAVVPKRALTTEQLDARSNFRMVSNRP